MDPNEQRIAIAKFCGWKINPCRPGQLYPPNLDPAINVDQVFDLPNYVRDLNAMHEAEKSLTNPFIYIYWLQTICGSHHIGQHNFANAAQRAEAFLKTIGNWKD